MKQPLEGRPGPVDDELPRLRAQEDVPVVEAHVEYVVDVARQLQLVSGGLGGPPVGLQAAAVLAVAALGLGEGREG